MQNAALCSGFLDPPPPRIRQGQAAHAPPCRRLEHVAQSVGIEPPITAGCDGERGLAPILGGLQRSIGTSSNQEALRLRCLPPRGCPCHNARSRFTQREA